MTAPRILWNEHGCIDELVVDDCTVHIEQMNDRCWWIGIFRHGAEWAGNFVCDSRGRMRFVEQDNRGMFTPKEPQ